MAARFWVGGSGTWDVSSTANWAATSGGASGASAPTTADTATFDSNSGTGTCVTAAGSTCLSCTLNTANVVLQLGANHTQTGSFILTQGSLDLNNFTLSSTTFSSSNTNTRSVNFGSSGQITLTATSGTLWTTSSSTNFTSTGTNKVVVAPNGGAGTRTFNPGAATLESQTISLNVTGGSDTVSVQNRYLSLNFTGFTGTVSGARTIYNDFTLQSGITHSGNVTFPGSTNPSTITTAGVVLNSTFTFDGAAKTWQFADAADFGTGGIVFTQGTLKLRAGATTTVTTFSSSGATPRQLQSTSAGTQAALSQSSGSVSVANMTIKDINATGGATWLAYTTDGNVDDGNNTGWVFSAPVVLDTSSPISLRSFTQRQRF